ncbi:hypothetical protein [Noviherbaspirillum pedocola]|uniref:Uncharacterized protein n=1 Tax=Noviherbaspirillum pedocola TaxID=2801341 RepID=A0A934SRM2_9BURK|nr:hypothetical protein [Noviherbaspirillum pedocola]MBK4734224.1 hypothetical protein [Noviherbaspirillum pedocola]
MQQKETHLPTEADIGSGEKGPAEQETQKMIEQIGDKVSETHQQKDGQRERSDNPRA